MFLLFSQENDKLSLKLEVNKQEFIACIYLRREKRVE